MLHAFPGGIRPQLLHLEISRRQFQRKDILREEDHPKIEPWLTQVADLVAFRVVPTCPGIWRSIWVGISNGFGNLVADQDRVPSKCSIEEITTNTACFGIWNFRPPHVAIVLKGG